MMKEHPIPPTIPISHPIPNPIQPEFVRKPMIF